MSLYIFTLQIKYCFDGMTFLTLDVRMQDKF